MFFGLQEWESSTSAWRIIAEEFSIFLKTRSSLKPGISDRFRREIQRWLGDDHLPFFNVLIDELICMGTWATLDNKQSLTLMREAAINFPKPPKFGDQILATIISIDLGI